jgi:hypothetical protein
MIGANPNPVSAPCKSAFSLPHRAKPDGAITLIPILPGQPEKLYFVGVAAFAAWRKWPRRANRLFRSRTRTTARPAPTNNKTCGSSESGGEM